jgi:plastocyanin
MNIELLSNKTSWLRGKKCDECKENFNVTVEFKEDGEYTNMCHPCFADLFKQDVKEV